MSIARYFTSSKKKDFRSKHSEVGDDTKKMREDSSTTSFAEDDVFWKD